MIEGRDRACLLCHRRVGDHTLDEYAACLGTPSHVVEHEPTPADAAELLMQRIAGLDGYTIADTFTARSAVLDSAMADGLVVHVPAVLFEFAIGAERGPTVTANVALLGSLDAMRSSGRVIRDTCNAAANAAEKRAR